MPQFRLIVHNPQGEKEEYICDVYDQVIDEQGYLQLFTYFGPISGRKIHVHLVRHTDSIADTASTVFSGLTNLRSAKGLLEEMEEYAREKQWYDTIKYASFRQHIGTVGVVLGSAVLLHKFLKDHAFSRQGYYDGKGNLVMPYLIDTNDNNMYAP